MQRTKFGGSGALSSAKPTAFEDEILDIQAGYHFQLKNEFNI